MLSVLKAMAVGIILLMSDVDAVTTQHFAFQGITRKGEKESWTRDA